MNNYGCSLVWGHPQAPMGTRSIIELIEELALRGGGFGLFTGCAAGDTAMAVVLEVDATEGCRDEPHAARPLDHAQRRG
jgi:acetyl-CoA acetyltransferase